MIRRRGMMFAVSSPSGGGKTSLCRRLLECYEDLELSVSVTTRARRPLELHGKDYHFLDEAQFHAMRKGGELIEHARVFSNWYGTPREPVERALEAGYDMLFDIDWQGVRQLAHWSRDDLVSLFLLPPHGKALLERLRGRDGEDGIGERMALASREIGHFTEYDYVLVNRDLDESVEGAGGILCAERLNTRRNTGLGAWVRRLQGEL